tara:strand:+ start:11150 stop:11557 length:408 start_codon:yes stop_codon:yes gene_type:complete
MIETEILINILAFVLGMLFHKICSDAIGMGYLGLFVRVIEFQSLKLLQILDEDAGYVRELKIKMLKQAGVEGESIKFIKGLDAETLRVWRESVITHFIAAYPARYRSRLEFSDWSGAMRQVKYVERAQNDAKQFK